MASVLDKKYKEMTESPVGRLIFKMAVPAVLANVVAITYSLTDTFYIGMIGTAASAASGVVLPIIVAIQAFGLLFGIGAGNKMSIALGKKDVQKASTLVSSAFYSSLAFGLLLALIVFFSRDKLIWVLGSTPSIAPYALSYMIPLLVAAPFFSASFVLNPILRFQGMPVESMIGIVTGAVLNAILEPIFIFTLKMGMFGAGVATGLCQAISFFILLGLYVKRSGVPIKFKNVSFARFIWSEIFAGGLPSLIRNLMLSISVDILNVASNPYGDAAIAAMTIVGKIITLTNSANIGIGQGYQPVCGYNYGAKKFGRVRYGYWLTVVAATILILVVCIIQSIWAPEIIRVFRDAPHVISYGSLALQIMSITFPLSGYIVMSNMMQQTIGHTIIATIVGLGRQGIFLVPALLILPSHFGFMGVVMSQPIADISTFLMTIPLQIYVMRGLRTPHDKSSKNQKNASADRTQEDIERDNGAKKSEDVEKPVEENIKIQVTNDIPCKEIIKRRIMCCLSVIQKVSIG